MIESTLSALFRRRLIVGIDYGTTYSGISLAMSNATDFREIRPWTAYPGSSSHCAEHSEKAPSLVAFADENDELDENSWGYQVEPGMKTYAWTKLLLDDGALQSKYDDPDLKETLGRGIYKLPDGKTAKDVATEYLRGLNHMFRQAVREKFGGEDRLEHLPVDIWLTVPATWTEKAKLLTKAAALDAGFASKPIDRLRLISEPEAAAHLALKSSIHHVQDLVQENSGVMVADLGGGTVDITCYKVSQKSPSLELEELCVGAGGKCGGTFVDRNLHRLMANRFGNAFTSLDAQMIGPGSQFMDQFELKKRDFSMKTPSRRALRLTLPMKNLKVTEETKKYYEDNFNYVLLTQQDMKALFDPVVDRIVGLVAEQLERVKRVPKGAIDTMVLVGGFGSSPYIKERLQKWCQAQSIRLTTPWSGAWSAVVCGAVLRGIEGAITRKRRCRKHYGFEASYLYKPEVHSGYDKATRRTWYSRFLNDNYLTGFMEWCIAKGAVLDENSSFDFSINQETYSDICTKTLYSCNADEAPSTLDNSVAAEVETVGDIEFNIANIDKSTLLKRANANGEELIRVPLVFRISLSDRIGHLTITVFHRNIQVGRGELRYD
ncbi:hsp70-like protein [Stachybotrys elegans]|uniref:Hsp70-like protein n=1 Tax=Stachybotrys elegans TaxID=80388 RepID=A0A8K0WU60_9HYPO|nr:hsp70-like protein [Stachybotrys elegans]